MTFPTGWTHKALITVDHTKVTGTPTNAVIVISASQILTSFIDAGATSAQDGGGDIRITADSAGTQVLPIEVVEFHPDATSGNRRCEIFVNTAGFEPSSSIDTVYYAWCKGPSIRHQPYPSHAAGAEKVWSSVDYTTVNHFNETGLPEACGLYLMRPRAVEYNGAVYMTWLDYNAASNGDIKVSKYSNATGQWTAAVTVGAALQKDGHASPTIAVDNSGYVYVIYADFQNTGQISVRKSTNPEDISAWGSAVTITTGATERTYPRINVLSNNNLVATWRDDDIWNKSVSTDGGATWGTIQAIVSSANRAYCEFILGPSDRLHVAWHYVNGGTNGVNFSYMYSDNPASSSSTWKAVDGTAISVPVAPAGPNSVATGRVFDSSAFSSCYLLGLAVDGSNNPMVTGAAFDTGTPSNNCYKSFTYSGGSWTGVNIMTGSTVGINVSGLGGTAQGGTRYISGTTWRALCSVTVSGFAEVQEYESTNGGTSWTKIFDVTTGGSSSTMQPQYVWNTTGAVASVMFNTPLANATNPGYNFGSDIFFAGDTTDGVASWARTAFVNSGTARFRDSTKYLNHTTTASGSPTTADSTMGWGGKALSLNGSNYVTAPKTTSNSSAMASSMHVEIWGKHTSSGSTEKICNRDGGGTGASSQWGMYHSSGNAISSLFANGSSFQQAISATSATAGVVYRMVGQFSSNAVTGRYNKTAVTGGALTGPLITSGSEAVQNGNSMNGTQDEFRTSATIVGTNTLDTQYDSMSSPATFATWSESVTPSKSVSRSIVMG